MLAIETARGKAGRTLQIHTKLEWPYEILSSTLTSFLDFQDRRLNPILRVLVPFRLRHRCHLLAATLFVLPILSSNVPWEVSEEALIWEQTRLFLFDGLPPKTCRKPSWLDAE